MSNRHSSWLLPALSIVLTMLVTGGVLLYLNPDRASALDDVVPTGGSLVVAAAESENPVAATCRAGSTACFSATSVLSANDSATSCTPEQCAQACNEAGVECTPERMAACIANGQCSGSGSCTGAGTCIGGGKGACAPATTPATSSTRTGGCCSR